MIYQELALNSLTVSHPDTVQRICAMFLGAERLVVDLRHLNPGAPENKYDVFFTHMEALIEESLVTSDDRRQGASHLPQWVSIKDLKKKDVCAMPRRYTHSLYRSCEVSIYPENPL